MQPPSKVVTVGHALVDVLARSPESLLGDHGLQKGTMTLVDTERAEKIYGSLGPATEASGGSAANTAACLASLGGRVEFAGRVADDELGRVFVRDIRAAGVTFDVAPVTGGAGTGRSMIMVTPDAEKTMCTSLGAGAELAESDLKAVRVEEAEVLYVEGFLCGGVPTHSAVRHAIERARRSSTLVSLSLSDSLWVEAQRESLHVLLEDVDLLFSNEVEAMRMSGAADVEGAAGWLSERCETVVVTRGGEGSIVVQRGQTWRVPSFRVDEVVDTTGAGDSFAGGYLFGVTRGFGPIECARLGAAVASEVVSHMGARPLLSLQEVARSHGFEVD